MADSPYILERVTFGYRTPVLEDICLRIPAGRLCGIIGPNGSGKSTLIEIMAGLNTQAKGEVRFRGRDIGSIGRRELALEIAYCPQNPVFFHPFSVMQAVLMGRYPHLGRFSSPDEEDFRAVEMALALTELGDKAERKVTELSGGERKRVALARAFAQDTGCVLLDEPTSDLDPRHGLEIMRACRDFAEREGRLAVVITHDLNLAASFCHNMVVLREGRVMAYGNTADVLSAETLKAAFEIDSRVFYDAGYGSLKVIY